MLSVEYLWSLELIFCINNLLHVSRQIQIHFLSAPEMSAKPTLENKQWIDPLRSHHTFSESWNGAWHLWIILPHAGHSVAMQSPTQKPAAAGRNVSVSAPGKQQQGNINSAFSQQLPLCVCGCVRKYPTSKNHLKGKVELRLHQFKVRVGVRHFVVCMGFYASPS